MRQHWRYLGIYAKGMAMGLADLIPGISGGTIAFITGIYDELLGAITRLNPKLLVLWREQGFLRFWQQMCGNFLLSLLAGMLTSIFLFAKIINAWLQHQPMFLWAFFFGLILASASIMGRQLDQKRPSTWGLFSLGFTLALLLTLMTPTHFMPTYPMYFFGAMIAISAMILPGISGSFILLLLGLYQPVIHAVHVLDSKLLLIVAAGCVSGLLLFSNIVQWFLTHHRPQVQSFLTGVMCGALHKIWPWKNTQLPSTNIADALPSLINVSPFQYAFTDIRLWGTLGLLLCGSLLVLGLHACTQKSRYKERQANCAPQD